MPSMLVERTFSRSDIGKINQCPVIRIADTERENGRTSISGSIASVIHIIMTRSDYNALISWRKTEVTILTPFRANCLAGNASSQLVHLPGVGRSEGI